MSGSGILLFGNDSNAGSASSDYDKDVFQDVSLPASNNTGFSSTVSKNPLGAFYANDAAPKWMAKTLFIKDLTRVEDQSLWINGRATYKIIWNEDFPGADGYVFGSVSLGGTAESRYVSINDLGDGCGVSGVIRRVQWLVRPQSGTATATPALDGSNLTNIDFGGYTNLGNAFATVKPMFEAYTTDTTNASRDIHDHRLTANQTNKLQIIGCVVYYNVSGDGLDLFGGTVYVDKSRSTPSGSTLSYPLGLSSFLGGWDSISVNANGAFSATFSPVEGIAAACSGAVDTNLLNVSIGSGASFPIGSAIYVPNSATYYIGEVTNVSGDVLTVGPTIPFGLSNICTKLFEAGPSLVISSTLLEQSFSWQAGVAGRTLGSSLIAGEAPFSFSDPYLRYRLWGSTLQTLLGSSQLTGLGQTYGLRFPATSDFLRFEGKFSALEFEFLVGQSAIIAATYAVDGVVVTGVSTPIDGPTVMKQTVMTNAGMGWHSVLFSNAGTTNAFLSRINAYEPKAYQGASYGKLAQVAVGQTFVLRNSQGITLQAFGNVQRVYAESLRANGSGWTSIPEATGPGGRSIFSAVDGDYAEFQYFGTRFALLGSAGTSTIMSINGGSATTPTFNAWSYPEATLGFQTVKVTSKAGTLKLFGYDFLSVGEVRNKQMFDPLASLAYTPRVFSGPSEPLNARVGDVWEVDVQKRIAYQKIFGGWQQFQPFNPPIGSSLIGTITRTNMYGVSQMIGSATGGTVTGSLVYVDCTSGVTLITTGRPVLVMIAPANESARMSNTRPNIAGFLRLYRDGATSLGGVMISHGATSSIVGNPCFSVLDPVSAGTHSWVGQVATENGSGDAGGENLIVTAYEL
jgi:hypothetical protein